MTITSESSMADEVGTPDSPLSIAGTSASSRVAARMSSSAPRRGRVALACQRCKRRKQRVGLKSFLLSPKVRDEISEWNC